MFDLSKLYKMHGRKRIKYEYKKRSFQEFLKWLYHGLKARMAVKLHSLLSDILGEERYFNALKRLRCRKIREDEFIELRKIDPDTVEYVSPTREKQKWYSTGKLKNGGWDKGLDRYNDLPFHRAMIKRVKEDIKWDEIEEVQEARKGGIKWPGKPYNVDRDIQKTEELLENIKENGYRSQEEIRNISYEEAEKNWDFKALNEVCVDLDRNGDPLFVDGRHRLSIAKILGIDEIPVRIVMRHRNLKK